VPFCSSIHWIVRVFFLGLFSIIETFYVYGQSSGAIFQHLSTNQGLPNFYTTAAVQDKAGFIWIGTFSGLVRYDGHRFKIFAHELGNTSSLSSNYIRTVFTTRNGTIWVGTALGLNRFNSHTGHFERFYFTKWGERCNNIRFITEDTQGLVWLGTSGGIFVLNPQTKQIKLFPLPTDPSFKKPDYSIHHILADSKQVWIGTDMGLYCYHTDTKSFEVFRKNNKPESIPENTVFALAKNPLTGHIAVGSRNSTLALFDPKTKHFRKISIELGGNYSISTLIYAQDGTFWGSTYGGGVFTYDETQEQTRLYQHDIHNPSGLCSNIINGIFQDQSGLIWFCSTRDGISRFNPALQMFNYPFDEVGYKPTSANGMRINKPFVDKFNHLWVASGDGLVWVKTVTKQYKHTTVWIRRKAMVCSKKT